jgi:tetratricopeptide (TPR) repeat protein
MRCYASPVRLAAVVLFASLTGVTLSGTMLSAATARAQDDWGITRDRTKRPANPDRPRNPRTPRNPRNPATPNPRNPPAPETEAQPAADTGRTAVLIQRYLTILERDPREGFAFQRLVDLYRERDGNIDGLVREFEERVARDPNAFAPRMLVGHVYRAQNRIRDAAQSYTEAARIDPNAVAPTLALAAIASSEGDGARARALYDQALTRMREPTERQDILRRAGEIAIAARDFDGARRYYDELARGADSSVYLRTEFARVLAAQRLHEQAIAEYERVLASLRGDNRVIAPVLRELGQVELDAGRVDRAIERLERALDVAGPNAGVRAEIYDVIVEAYRRGNRLPELIARLERETGSFEVLELLGKIHDELGHDAEALDAYRRALSRNPRHVDTRVRVVQLLSRSGRIDEVIREYETLVRTSPGEPRFVVELAQLLMQVGRRQDALAKAAEIGRRSPRDPTVHQALAELYSRWGEDELAAREVALLARIEPNDPAHLIALGAQELDAGNRAAALQTWRRILQADPDRARAHATLGGVLADHDMLEDAATEYEEATRLEPTSLDYARGLANVYERLRRDDDAIAAWRRVLQLSGEDRNASREGRQRIVGVWQRNRSLGERVRELERSFGREPPDIEAGRFLAEAYRRLGSERTDDAERVLERVISLAPGDVESLLALERVKAARGDLAGAIEVLARLVEADSRRAAHYLGRMAEYALALYRDEDAIRYAEQAALRTPDDANGHERLGDLYRARQDVEAAIRSYRRALELNDRLYETYFELAELHLSRGDFAEADALYRQVLADCPDDDLVSRAARASLQIHLGDGTLVALERELLPLSLANPQRPIFRKLVVELYDALTAPLIVRAAGDGPDSEAALRELRDIGARSIKPLLEALADTEPAQRRVAVDVLGHLGNPNAAVPLLAAAEGEGDMNLRIRALLAAGAVADGNLAPRFLALARGPERRLRTTATWGLVHMGSREAIPALRELVGESDTSVRAFAALGLGVAGDGASAQVLERLLREDRSVHVEVAAAYALGRLAEADRAPALIAALRGRSGIVAATAAHALSEIGDAAARQALAQAAFDPDPALRRAAIAALGRIGDERDAGRLHLPIPVSTATPASYVETLIARERATGPVELGRHRGELETAAREALRGPVERVRTALGVLTAELPSTSAEAAPSEDVRRFCAALLPDLLAASRHADASIRALAIRALAIVADPQARDALAAALDDPESVVVRAALEGIALGEQARNGEAAARVAAILLQDREWSTRTLAARAAARLQGSETQAALIRALDDDEFAFVRDEAARSLAILGGDDALEALRSALVSDREPAVRVTAARALASSPRGQRLLDEAARTGDRAVREAIARSRE